MITGMSLLRDVHNLPPACLERWALVHTSPRAADSPVCLAPPGGPEAPGDRDPPPTPASQCPSQPPASRGQGRARRVLPALGGCITRTRGATVMFPDNAGPGLSTRPTPSPVPGAMGRPQPNRVPNHMSDVLSRSSAGHFFTPDPYAFARAPLKGRWPDRSEFSAPTMTSSRSASVSCLQGVGAGGAERGSAAGRVMTGASSCPAHREPLWP